MTARTFKWGILGAGKIASDFVASLKEVSDAKVVAVGARSLKSAEDFATKWSVPKKYGSYKELVSDPEVEIVYISTIHPTHYECTKLALEHGKHVLCEKPFTLNALEATEIINFARSKKLMVMEAMWTRFFPAIIKLRELIKTNTIGELAFAQGDFGFKDTSIPRINEPQLGGGALLDIGVYVISFASMLLGPQLPTSIQATGTLLPSGVDQQVSINLNYGGKLASLFCTVKGETPREFVVVGTDGYIKVHSPFWCATHITLHRHEGKEETFEFPLPSSEPLNFTRSIGLHYEAKHIQECIANGKTDSDVMSTDETIVIMQIMDNIRKQIGVNYPNEKH